MLYTRFAAGDNAAAADAAAAAVGLVMTVLVFCHITYVLLLEMLIIEDVEAVGQ